MHRIYPTDSVADINGIKISVSENVKLSEKDVKKLIRELLAEDEMPIRIIESVCPACAEEQNWNKMFLHAIVFEKDGKVLIRKKCEKHGIFEDVYWHDVEYFRKQVKFADKRGTKVRNTQIKTNYSAIKCPLCCGLCKKHKSHTTLANLVVTNRCDLSCWYCFFYQRSEQPVYEPSLEQIKEMLLLLRNQKPVPCNAIQLTGGEPAVREDLPEIVKMCRKLGFEHVQLNTNGIRFSKDYKFLKKVVEAGANVFYLSFDGVTPETNPKNFWEVPKTIANIRRTSKAGIVLVPTVIGGVNTHELGDIIRYAAFHIDVVRGVNFQPVSLVGMMPTKEREKQRVTIPKAIKLIEEQTDGAIAREDFYVVPFVKAVSDFVEAIKGTKQYRLSTHFACGAATYVFFEGRKMVPITRFLDVEGFMEFLEEQANEIKKSRVRKLSGAISGLKLIAKINSFVIKENVPKGLNISKMLVDALIRGNYDGLREFHYKSLFIGMMHFMDPYNYDVDRVERCCIHYVMPNKRIVPFCAFNVFPELYRDKVQKEYSIPVKEWEKRTGKKASECKYVRKLSKEEKERILRQYRRALSKFGKK